MKILIRDKVHGDLLMETEFVKIIVEADGTYNLRVHIFNYFVNITVADWDSACKAFESLRLTNYAEVTGTFNRLPPAYNKM